jgi:hypothetical protein
MTETEAGGPRRFAPSRGRLILGRICALMPVGRIHYTLEEVGLADPRTREPVRSTWDGLVDGAEETFRRVHALLPRGSQTAPICSPVSSHAALAECEEAEYLDNIGRRFWIPLHGPVCENAAPRFGSSGTIDDNAMEQWSY